MGEIYAWKPQIANTSGYAELAFEVYNHEGTFAEEVYSWDGAAAQQVFPGPYDAAPEPTSSGNELYDEYHFNWTALEGMPATGDAAANGWVGVGWFNTLGLTNGPYAERIAGAETTNNTYFRDSWGRQNLAAISWDRYTATGAYIDTLTKFTQIDKLYWNDTDDTNTDPTSYDSKRRYKGEFPWASGEDGWGFEYDEIWAKPQVSGPRFHYYADEFIPIGEVTGDITRVDAFAIDIGTFPSYITNLAGCEAGTRLRLFWSSGNPTLEIYRDPPQHGGESTENWLKRIGQVVITVTRNDYDPGVEHRLTDEVYGNGNYFYYFYGYRLIDGWTFSSSVQNSRTIREGENVTFKIYKQPWGA